MDAAIKKQIDDVIAELERGTEPHAVRISGVAAVELVEPGSTSTPRAAFCPDGTQARCEIAYDSKGRQYCIWRC